MLTKLVKYKPGVERKTHLLVAACIWPLVGTMLFSRGVRMAYTPGHYWYIISGITIGWLKSYFVLDRTAKKGIERILKFGDNTCVGAVYSLKTWVMVLAMILAGYLLRHSPIPIHFVGLIYLIVGSGLIISSRHAWISWYKLITTHRDNKTNQSEKNDV